LSTASALTFSSTIGVTGGTLTFPSGKTISSGRLTVNGATAAVQQNGANLTVAGLTMTTGTFTSSASSLSITNTSTFAATTDLSALTALSFNNDVTVSAGTTTFPTLNVTLGGTLTVSGTGVFVANGSSAVTLTIDDLAVSGGTFTVGTSKIHVV